MGKIPGRDTFNHKAKQANGTLKSVCKEESILFILHHGINKRFNLSSHGLHLIDRGVTCLGQDFKLFLSEVEFGY